MIVSPTPAFLVTVSLLLIGLAPISNGLARSVRQNLRSLDLNRVDRKSAEAGYYEGLINVGQGGGRSDLAMCLVGKPPNVVDFQALGATRQLPGQLLQFELRPGLYAALAADAAFTTNAQGLRDRAYPIPKPPGTFRIVLLGTSIDMGWGVGDDETYENRIEDWLNSHARKRNINRRFEVINLATAAYSPLHRLEAFEQKALAYEPDMVLYAATLLDTRLLEIHMCTLLQSNVDLGRRPFLTRALSQAGIGPADLARGPDGEFTRKSDLKAKLQPRLWPLIDATLGELAADCRSRGLPLFCVIVPRAGNSDQPGDREPGVRRYKEIIQHNKIRVLDLMDVFDDEDPAAVEIAPFDDHPNARGHDLLFRALAQHIVDDRALYHQVFGVEQDDPARWLPRKYRLNP